MRGKLCGGEKAVSGVWRVPIDGVPVGDRIAHRRIADRRLRLKWTTRDGGGRYTERGKPDSKGPLYIGLKGQKN